jgi:hypothetical protein
MARLRPDTAAILLCVGFSGCSASSAPPALPQPPVQAAPIGPVSFDGVYNGTTQLISGSNLSCGSQDPLTFRVVDDAFSYTLNQPQVVWQPVRSFDVAIAHDGSFQSQSGTASIQGRVSGGHMQGQIVGDACGFAFEADRSGTW